MTNNANIDIDEVIKPQRSDIKLESNNMSESVNFNGYALNGLYADFIFAEYIDITKGVIKDENGFFVSVSGDKTWRKAKIIMVSPFIQTHGLTKVGDIVTFPNDKGLQCGTVAYTIDGEIKTTENGIFLNENRIFGKLIEHKE